MELSELSRNLYKDETRANYYHDNSLDLLDMDDVSISLGSSGSYFRDVVRTDTFA